MQTSTHVHTHREMYEIALISWDTIFHITWIYNFNLEKAFTVLKKVYNSFVLYSNTNVRSDIRITVYIPTVYLSKVVAICCTHNIYETNSSQYLAYISQCDSDLNSVECDFSSCMDMDIVCRNCIVDTVHLYHGLHKRWIHHPDYGILLPRAHTHTPVKETNSICLNDTWDWWRRLNQDEGIGFKEQGREGERGDNRGYRT